MERKKIILPSKRFFKAEDEDLSVRLQLQEEKNLLREGDRNISLDLEEQFNKERNESNLYKIYGKLKMVYRNMYLGTTSYEPLQKNLYLIEDGSTANYSGYTPYNEFAFLRNDVLREETVIDSGNDLSGFTPSVILSGYTGHTIIPPINAPYHNWNIHLSYVDAQDNEFPIKYTLSGDTFIEFLSGDGIPFRVTEGDTYYEFTSPVKHGLSLGEYVTLSGDTLTGATSGRTFAINELGNQIYRSEEFSFRVYKNQFISGTTLSNIMLGKRVLNLNNISGTTSQYYVHKHKILTDTNQYLLDNIGFESNIWENERKVLFQNQLGENDVIVERNRMESLIYDFKEPFLLSGITNNLGYPPTDLYVTIVLRNGNGYFSYPPKVGYKFNFHDSWIDYQFSGDTANEVGMTGATFTGNTDSIIFTGGTALPIGTVLTGAFVEYNESDLKERIISESFHKFSLLSDYFDHGQEGDRPTFTGATSGNTIGLLYQPHYRVKIRQLSPYIETSNTEDVYNLPDNVKYFSDEGVWKWRDLYDHGFIDQDGFGTNFPFLNGIHYVKNDINFYLRNEEYYTNKEDGLKGFGDFLIEC